MNRPMRDGGGPGRDGSAQTMKAVVLIVVLVAIGVAVLARSKPNHPAVASTTTTRPHSASTTTLPAPTTTVPALIPASQVKVQVLNGVLTGSLAGEWSTKLKTKFGYLTEPADNATAKVAASTIYVLTPGYVPEADALATAVGLQQSAVNTTIPAPSSAPIPSKERATANLVLVIGPDLAASA